jgi:hypothetical protein
LENNDLTEIGGFDPSIEGVLSSSNTVIAGIGRQCADLITQAVGSGWVIFSWHEHFFDAKARRRKGRKFEEGSKSAYLLRASWRLGDFASKTAWQQRVIFKRLLLLPNACNRSGPCRECSTGIRSH